MSQAAFDLERAHARATDPETSHEAAASISLKRLSECKNRILTLLQARGSLIDEWLVAAYREEFPHDRTTPQNIRSRRAWLMRHGYIEWAETWGKTLNDRRSRKWKLTDKGRAVL